MPVLRILLSLAVSALCLYFAVHNVNLSELKEIISHARVMPMVFSLLVSIVTFGLRGLRWQILLSGLQEFPLLTLVRWQIGGIFINNLLPLRAGEISRAYWSGKVSGVPKSSIFATIVVERVCDVASLAAILSVLLVAMGFSHVTGKQWTLGGIGIIAAVFIIGFLWKKYDHAAAMNRLRAILPQKLHEIVEKFTAGFHILKNKKEAAKVLLLSPLIWAIDIGAVMIFSRSLGLNLSWMQAGFTMGGLVLGIMIPAAPGAVGTYEAGGKQALMLLGFPETLSFSFIAFLHAVQYLFVTAMGIPILMAEGFSPKKIFTEIKEA